MKGLIISLALGCSTAVAYAGDPARVRPSLPLGEWEVVAHYTIDENGRPKPRGTLMSDRLQVKHDSYAAYKLNATVPWETGELKIIKLATNGEGILDLGGGAQGNEVYIYRFRGNRMEFCADVGNLKVAPPYFGAKNTVIFEFLPRQRDRLVATYPDSTPIER